LLADSETKRLVSAVSITEMAIKESIGKIEAAPEQVSRMVADLKAEVIPYAPRHAMRMFRLPLHHREPFDRMLIATAITESIPLVGGDARFPAYKQQGLTVIWK
jgi:PIN domain nuclease of toxin-antitoxin system